MTPRSRVFYGWVILTVGFVTIVGGYVCRNTFSVFYPAIVEEFGWTRGNTALIFSINILTYGLVAPFAGALADRFRPRFVLATGAVLIGSGMALCSLASSQWQFYLLYGVLAAAGLSIAGWAPVSTLLANWFVRRRALAFGILGAGFGISLVSAYAAQYIILSAGWRSAYLVIGLFIALLVAPVCVFFIRRTPAEKGLFPDGLSEAQTQADARQRATYPESNAWRQNEWTLSRAMRTRQYWLLFGVFVMSMGVVEQLAVSHQVYFYLDAGYRDMNAATFYSIFGICFAIGNILGAISDRIGRERLFIPSCLTCAVFASLYFVMDAASNWWLAPAIAIGFGTAFGTVPCVLNATLADLFHGRQYGRIAGTMIVGFAVGGTLSPWVAGYLHDVTGTYTTTYILLLASLLASATMMWLAAPRKLTPVRRLG